MSKKDWLQIDKMIRNNLEAKIATLKLKYIYYICTILHGS